MKSIEIIIGGLDGEKKILIECNKKRIIVNEKIDFISQEKIDELIRIIRTWKNQYVGSLIDGDSFFIRINMESGSEVIEGRGKYPDNYLNFKEWVSDFYE